MDKGIAHNKGLPHSTIFISKSDGGIGSGRMSNHLLIARSFDVLWSSWVILNCFRPTRPSWVVGLADLKFVLLTVNRFRCQSLAFPSPSLQLTPEYIDPGPGFARGSPRESSKMGPFWDSQQFRGS